MKTFDRYDLMRLFIRISEAGSLSAAAKSMGLSQPSASRQLQQLEALMGNQLIQRSTHDLKLTESGELFLLRAKAMVSDWDSAAEAALIERDDLRGSIRVAAPVALGQNLLATIAAHFLSKHPAISMDWRLSDNPGNLVSGGYDIWITASHVSDESLIVKKLWTLNRTIVAAKGGVQSAHPRDLVQRSAVVLLHYVSREVCITGPGGEEFVLRLAPSFTTDNLYACLTAIREGAGYGILPVWAVQQDIDEGRLVQLCPYWRPPSVTLSAAYTPERRRSARVSAFLEYLSLEFPRIAAGILSAE